MVKPENECDGCVYWRNTAYGGFKHSDTSYACHFLLDTGRSRLKLCGDGKCTVRKERKKRGKA